jgi:hypothetical protein
VSWDVLATIVGILVVAALGSRWLWIKYGQHQRVAQSPYIAVNPEDPTGDLSDEEILQRLLAAVDRRDYGAIEVYAKALFEDRSDIDLQPAVAGLRDPVLRAALDGDVKLFESLATARSAFGGADDAGRRAIHVAAANNHANIVRWLIERDFGAINDPIRGTGVTPLHLAAAENATDAVAELVRLGADANSVSARNRNALHYAADRGASLGAAALLTAIDLPTRAALITAQDDEGNTPLHIAARAGHLDVVTVLLQAGSSPLAKNAAGKAPADLATDEGHADLVDLLRK